MSPADPAGGGEAHVVDPAIPPEPPLWHLLSPSFSHLIAEELFVSEAIQPPFLRFDPLGGLDTIEGLPAVSSPVFHGLLFP